MATGDVTLSMTTAGGNTKTVTIASDIRVLAKSWADANTAENLSSDDAWMVSEINKLATKIVSDANKAQEQAAVVAVTAKTFTRAT